MATVQTIRTSYISPVLSARELGCLHAQTGRAPETKMCAFNHECGTCPYDQMLDETAHVRIAPVEPRRTAARAA
jgi:hypothetical protein